MLVLSRFKGEAIWIGPDIRVLIRDVKGNQVQMGFDAPKDVAIHREEIYERIKRGETPEGS